MPRKAIERPYNANQWTRARYFGFIRSALRLASRKWPPRIAAKNAVRRPYKGPNKRQKWEYQCAMCRQWFMDKECEVDHIQPCGRLASYDDLPEFVRRLFTEAESLRVLCKGCHNKLTERHTNKE